MLRIHVAMKFTNEPVKRTPVTLYLDTRPEHPIAGSTDRRGTATFDIPPVSGKVLVNGTARFHGRLEGDVEISLWSPIDAGTVADSGAPGGDATGSIAYPGMQVRLLDVEGHGIQTDSEGYLVNLGDWSEAFVRAQAASEGLVLTDEIWEVIRFLRDYYEQHRVQANVREIIRHFRKVWGPERGSNRHLHTIFPRGGPQKQGNRLAGLLRTKGEH
ncbi:MAG: TusE/DsrC/DsvC family sulfur relay protein [Gammaproteobacteria bacterium]|jgi:tRNA 2-thiouridine synthesizing protein E